MNAKIIRHREQRQHYQTWSKCQQYRIQSTCQYYHTQRVNANIINGSKQRKPYQAESKRQHYQTHRVGMLQVHLQRLLWLATAGEAADQHWQDDYCDPTPTLMWVASNTSTTICVGISGTIWLSQVMNNTCTTFDRARSVLEPATSDRTVV